ncbi:succinate dehydrogenase assembly factor 4, mitochondrial [Salarias fasciatus]|uniref:Succinate dehydrogenase assembly factor 4, mitochondrial n=1 Tax=Salarias fasciatus TaxID=181472 RepID=A0A672ICT9_SALFA|nr:succinate dehydrogenase assembly factor 4, mitochondrial [Salarias fasciatus]
MLLLRLRSSAGGLLLGGLRAGQRVAGSGGSGWSSRFRSASGAVKEGQPLKKARTPQGRFDSPEDAKSRDALEKFPDDVNPVTKEKGGPRGPEPTRYGDWERKGRCVDF